MKYLLWLCLLISFSAHAATTGPTVNSITKSANGGTGVANPTAHAVMLGEGSSAMTPLGASATTGTVVMSNGSSADPSYQYPVSVTASSPDIVLNPTTGQQTFTVGTTELIHALGSVTTATIISSDMAKVVTNSASAPVAVTLPQAGLAGFGVGAAYSELNLGSDTVTITPTTSTVNGSSSLVLAACGSAPNCPWAHFISDGTNWIALRQ